MIRFGLLILFASAATPAAERFTGAESCRPCHAARVEQQSKSGHAHALSRAASHPLRAQWPLASTEARRGSKFRIRFDHLNARIDDGQDVLAVPLEWAFGAGSQAVTFVSRGDADNYLEHYLTYYSKIRAFRPTPGHASLRPANLAEAAGLLYRKSDPVAGIDGCFQCHSTGAGMQGEPGVQCEACHGPGGDHVAKPARQNIGNPGRLKSAELNDFCGRCHRPPASDPAKIDWRFAWNVRHQPVYLSQSKCFVKSAGRLGCLTCHSPHDPLAESVSHYDAKCANCHQSRSRECAPRDCAGCHMPRVSPEPPLRFANHWIGVYRGGNGLVPLRQNVKRKAN